MPKKPNNSRPARWSAAVADAVAAKDALEEALSVLRDVQAEYQEWRDNLPENLEGSATAEKLDAIGDLDLEIDLSAIDEAEGVELPLGFGRD